MKIYDCFLFFNELDLLDIRLHILNSIVDYFILVEAKKTHSGKNKILYYEKNKELFKDFQNKIIHIVIDFPRYSTTLYRLSLLRNYIIKKIKYFMNKSHKIRKIKSFIVKRIKILSKISKINAIISPAMKRDSYQRNAVMKGLVNVRNEDIILISDIDEIPRPEKILENLGEFESLAFQQKLYYFYINCLQNQLWSGTILTTGRHLRNKTPQSLRLRREEVKQIPDGGWHFSYIGGIERIITKLKSFAHTECNKKEYTNPAYIAQKIKNGKDLFDRNEEIFEKNFVPIDSSYPKCIFEMIKKYPYLIHNE